MKAVINTQDSQWPALYHLAADLGFSPERSGNAAGSASAHGLFWRFIRSHPFSGWIRGWLALEVYWECNCYIRYLLHQAEAIQNDDNVPLVRQIIRHAQEDLAFSARDAWGELSGLSVQKLRHVRYYEDVVGYLADTETE